MKKILMVLLVAVATIGMVFANGNAESKASATTEGEVGGTLDIWSFTNELNTFALAYQEAHPEVTVNYTLIPMTSGEYQTKVKAAISSGDVPDVIGLESAFVREYVESDMLMDLNDLLPLAEEMESYQFMLDVGTYEGVTKAYSYQATPGALFYRRSLAKEYFGTDDPVEIQEIFRDMDHFKAAAEIIKQKSNGNTFTVCSIGDFNGPFIATREKPWVVDGKLTIDRKVEEMMDIDKEFREKGYEAQATQWGAGWYAGMNDSLRDAAGNKKQIFCYFLPTWGLPYVLMPNSKPKTVDDMTVGTDTAGDWACIDGPVSYQWGGTWMGIMSDSKNAATAKDFIKFATLNEQTLENWALGVYTNEYLKKIDPTIGDDQAQGAGDFVNSAKVVREIVHEFDDAETSEFLGGQNSYQRFAEVAPNLSLKLLQGTDDAILRSLGDPLDAYVSGKISKEECIAQFKDAVRTAVPDIIVE
jgi:ABC-type glycerol-3-phosphate transport system substrate-binding protein